MTDSDRRWRTTTRRSALGLMSVGAAFFATETLGFTQLSADRGVNVAVADDDEAGFAITVSEDDNSFNDTFADKEEFDDNAFIQFENQTSSSITVDDGNAQIVDQNDQNVEDDITIIDESNGNGSIDIVDQDNNTFDISLPDEDDSAVLKVELDASANPPLNLRLDIDPADVGGAKVTLQRDFIIE